MKKVFCHAMRFKLPNHSLKSKSVWAAYRAATPIISYYLPKTIHTALIFVHNAKFCIFSLVKKSTLLFSRYYQNFFIWSNFSVKNLIQIFSPLTPFSTWYTFWHLLAWTWSSVEFYVPKKAIFSLQKQWSFIND